MLARRPSLVASFAALVACIVVFAAPPRVAADPEPEVSSEPEARPRDQWDRIIAGEIFGGVDTPYGLVGGAIVIIPVRNLAFDLGGGVSRDGGRVAGGVRLLLPFENAALGLRLGFAGGPLSWETEGAGHVRRDWDFNGYVDGSVSLEFRATEGFYGRLQFGVEHALSGEADRCTFSQDGTVSPCSGGSAPTRPYLGLALGYAFDV